MSLRRGMRLAASFIQGDRSLMSVRAYILAIRWGEFATVEIHRSILGGGFSPPWTADRYEAVVDEIWNDVCRQLKRADRGDIVLFGSPLNKIAVFRT